MLSQTGNAKARLVQGLRTGAMNIFVTGSGGFLGSYFRHFNTLKGHHVIYGSVSNGSDHDFVRVNDLYSNVGDVLSSADVDAIIHFATVIPKSFDEAGFENVFLPNVTMMGNLYSFAVRKKIAKFIYVSSFGSMKRPEHLDIRDFYTLSKVAGEHFCSMMEARGIQTASLRISSPYGEYSRAATVMNIFIERALNNEDIHVYGSGNRQQNFIYAGDITSAIELCLQKSISGIYSIVSKRNVTMLDLARLIITLTKSGSKTVLGSREDPQEDYVPR